MVAVFQLSRGLRFTKKGHYRGWLKREACGRAENDHQWWSRLQRAVHAPTPCFAAGGQLDTRSCDVELSFDTVNCNIDRSPGKPAPWAKDGDFSLQIGWWRSALL